MKCNVIQPIPQSVLFFGMSLLSPKQRSDWCIFTTTDRTWLEKYLSSRGVKYHDDAVGKKVEGEEQDESAIQAAFGLLHLHHDQPNILCNICGHHHLHEFGPKDDHNSNNEHLKSHAKNLEHSSKDKEFDHSSKEEDSNNSIHEGYI